MMPLQNRVTPKGDILALPERGIFMGNRGILHDETQRLGVPRWRHRHWVTCLLAFKGWHREVMQPRAYTELFFLDEPSALAAGHRPCALCRRPDYIAFQDALKKALHRSQFLSADGLDRMLHAARIETGRRQRRFEAGLDDLPSGSMVILPKSDDPGGESDIWLLWDKSLLRWRPGGYDRLISRLDGTTATVLTPRPTILTLQQGYQPILHPSAKELMGI